ncbi:MAG: hypothetical protein HWD59_13975 [Coxiellaceae bacterium]|nr:MAG: hypothetical protein HWD59_13975 [Coxiellaceae bacterium]
MKVYLIHRRKINDINIRMIRLKIEKAIKEGNLVGIYGEGIENFRKAKFAKIMIFSFLRLLLIMA